MQLRYGSPFAIKRYNAYVVFCQWKEHSQYKGFAIERAYESMQPKACYRAIDEVNDIVIVGEGLSQVKSAITRYKDGEKE